MSVITAVLWCYTHLLPKCKYMTNMQSWIFTAQQKACVELMLQEMLQLCVIYVVSFSMLHWESFIVMKQMQRKSVMKL